MGIRVRVTGIEVRSDQRRKKTAAGVYEPVHEVVSLTLAPVESDLQAAYALLHVGDEYDVMLPTIEPAARLVEPSVVTVDLAEPVPVPVRTRARKK